MQKPAPYSDSSKYNDYYTYDYHIPGGLSVNLTWDGKCPGKTLERLGNGLKFKTADGVLVSPLYDIHRQRYVVYWNIKNGNL